MRKLFSGLMVLLLLGAFGAAKPSAAQTTRCFSETGQCINGRMLSFWQENGGLPVFGMPITAARYELNPETGQSYLTQWFERYTLELHPENQAPYDVLLRRLGTSSLIDGAPAEALTQEIEAREGCLWFEETGFNLCDNQGAVFASYWRSHGLSASGMDAYQRSLALFGMPISRQFAVEGDSPHYIQFFERARFEWHPNKPEPYKVLLGLLGNENYAAPQDQPGWFENRDTSVDLIASFYNAINRQEYQRAYSYWREAPSSYENFVEGYNDTSNVRVIVQPPEAIDAGAGNLFQSVTTLLLAQQLDGSYKKFVGCYNTHKNNTEPDTKWELQSANIVEVPIDTTIWDGLAQACANQSPEGVFDSRNTPLDLLTSYYSAINDNEYRRAYGYWRNPPLEYDAFEAGFRTTTSVQLIVQPPVQYMEAPGKLYATIPMMLVSTYTTGEIKAFSGCYVANIDYEATPTGPKSGTWHIFNIALEEVPEGSSLPSVLSHGCSFPETP
jgi:hypothetical protein